MGPHRDIRLPLFLGVGPAFGKKRGDLAPVRRREYHYPVTSPARWSERTLGNGRILLIA